MPVSRRDHARGAIKASKRVKYTREADARAATAREKGEKPLRTIAAGQIVGKPSLCPHGVELIWDFKSEHSCSATEQARRMADGNPPIHDWPQPEETQ